MQSHRVHIPLIGNPDVKFEVLHPTLGTQTIDVTEGKIFELNNVYPHQVWNEGYAAPCLPQGP
jgi:hypothetical protein